MTSRIVIDANVYASALIKPVSIPGKALKFILQTPKFQLVLTQDIYSEIKKILFYKKVRKYISLTDHEILNWLESLTVVGYMLEPQFKHKKYILEDPEDDKYVVAALESRAKWIISGDKHLKSYHLTVTPREFLERVSKA